MLVDAGDVTVDDRTVEVSHLAYRAPGADTLVIATGATPARIVLLGGEPLGDQIVMWWNFIGRSHDEVVAFREEWQREAIGTADAPVAPADRFGEVRGYDGPALPAPVMPTVRLKPRG